MRAFTGRRGYDKVGLGGLLRQDAGGCRHAPGAGVANLVHLLDPEMIILGGGVLEASDLLLPGIRRWAASYASADVLQGARIVVSRVTKRSGIKGAAALFLYETGRPPRSA